MKLQPDLAVAFVLALGLHGALVPWSDPASAGGGGASGEDMVTVAAASSQATHLVKAWTRPIEAQTAAVLPKVPVAMEMKEVARPATDGLVSRRAPDGMARPERAASVPQRPEIGTPVFRPFVAEPLNGALALPSLVEESAPPAVPQTAPPKLSADTMPGIELAPPAPDGAPLMAARPLPKPARSAPPAVTRKRAAGSTLGAQQGAAPSDSGPALSAAERRSAQANWAAQIQQRIARHQSYPRGAREDGRVKVSMVIRANGQLGQVSIITSSGAVRLDQAALQAVKSAAPFPAAPDVLDEPYFTVGQWIRFERR